MLEIYESNFLGNDNYLDSFSYDAESLMIHHRTYFIHITEVIINRNDMCFQKLFQSIKNRNCVELNLKYTH